MLEIAVAVFFGLLAVALAIKQGLKTVIDTEKITETIQNAVEEVLDTALSDSEMQKKLYSVGVLIGSGISKGTGIQSSGKFKFEDIIGIGLAKLFGGITGGQQQQQGQNTNIPP